MEKDRQEALEWFVQFALLNLEDLKPGDRAKLEVEAREYLCLSQEEEEAAIKEVPYLSDKKIKEYLKKRSWEKDSIDWQQITKFQAVVRGMLKVIPKKYPIEQVLLSGDRIPPWLDVEEEYPPIWEGKVWYMLTTLNDKISLIIAPSVWSPDNYVRFKISSLFNDLPITTLSICWSCKNYFVNPTLRDKKFCSPRCMWRFNAKKGREELKGKHPGKYKAYLKKQREIMRRKYEEKQKGKGYKKVARYKRKED
jgi:hypothetical protein